jgi:plasmid stabilization system protein ParE
MIVEWSQTIKERILEIVEYLEEHFSLQAAQNFYIRLSDVVDQIEKYPTIGQPSGKKAGIRSMKIDKHKRVFYSYDENAQIIRMLDIFDSRQHPSKSEY